MGSEKLTMENVNLVIVADEGFSLPAAVAIQSAVETLATDRQIHVYLIDSGISDLTFTKLANVLWKVPQLQLTRVQVDLSSLADLPTKGHLPTSVYVRLLLPKLLPHLDRALYLDADVLVKQDLSQLWDKSLEGVSCLASPDSHGPYIDHAVALGEQAGCLRYVAAIRQIPNYRELGLRGDAPYFNSGVMLINLDWWRSHSVEATCRRVLADNRQHILWCDQYALNVVLYEKWAVLDPRWNQGRIIYDYPDWQHSPFTELAFYQLKKDPWIVHFTTAHKPWNFNTKHPFRDEWLQTVDRTSWRGWRPSPKDLPGTKVAFF